MSSSTPASQTADPLTSPWCPCPDNEENVSKLHSEAPESAPSPTLLALGVYWRAEGMPDGDLDEVRLYPEKRDRVAGWPLQV